MGVVGLLALAFVGWLMIATIRQSDLNSTDGGQPVQQQPAKPDQTPPLNR
jgi:hypothetical protein